MAVSLISPLCLFLPRPVLQAGLFSTRAAGCWGRGAARWCCRNRGPRLFGNKLDTRTSPEAGADGAATPADTGADGGGGSGKSMMARADNSPARGRRWSSGGGHGRGLSAQSCGSGGSKGAEGRNGKGSSKRAAPDGDKGSSRGGGKRARGGKTGQCEHKGQRNRCKECGGEGICQHGRQRSMCKTCKADKDEFMPPDLKVL